MGHPTTRADRRGMIDGGFSGLPQSLRKSEAAVVRWCDSWQDPGHPSSAGIPAILSVEPDQVHCRPAARSRLNALSNGQGRAACQDSTNSGCRQEGGAYLCRSTRIGSERHRSRARIQNSIYIQAVLSCVCRYKRRRGHECGSYKDFAFCRSKDRGGRVTKTPTAPIAADAKKT